MSRKNKVTLYGLKKGVQYLGIVSIDIAKHSRIKDNDQDVSLTRSAFLSMAEAQLPARGSWKMTRQGDGEGFLFDISKGSDEMILFADRILQLVHYFNRAKGKLNKLPNDTDIFVRIVCHAGNIVNNERTSGDLGGDALNELFKHEKIIGKAGKIVLTNEVFRWLSKELKLRCTANNSDIPFGQCYVLDHGTSSCQIQMNDLDSKQLRDWIVKMLAQRKFNKLLYFGYTNERLHDFLGFKLSGIEVKILVRNWLTEKTDEQQYNRNKFIEKQKQDHSSSPWLKSEKIKATVKEIMESDKWRDSKKSIDVRFYAEPPIFNGVILLNEEMTDSVAHIGIIKWDTNTIDGGSPYKLEEWAALLLDGNTIEHQTLLDYLASRFWKSWELSQSYTDVCKQQEIDEANSPSLIEQIWCLDSKPYKIIYPLRSGPNPNFPLVYHEDVKAFRAVEAFLKEYGVDSELHNFQLGDVSLHDWFPSGEEEKIEEWHGHIVYICARSISPNLKEYLRGIRFPVEFSYQDRISPHLLYLPTGEQIHSPMDLQSPSPSDYSLIGRFRRKNQRGFGYILAGIHSIGTWGAASYLTNPLNLRTLTQIANGRDFAAVLSTEFNIKTRENEPTNLLIAPQIF
ncbi:MAG: hypothetical protein QY332_14165 [Anaerolineales bacterium]|nr:MAG: hypothetical protein QY332_14165 [Anaerolineales bacterium]